MFNTITLSSSLSGTGDDQPVAPGALLGYRRNGQPIRLIAGGAQQEGEGQEGEGQQSETPPKAEVTPPADPRDDKVNPDAIRVDQLPAWGQKLFADLRKESADYREKYQLAQKSAKEAAEAKGPSAEEVTAQAQAEFAQKIGKALGLIAEEEQPLDPQQVIDKLTSEKDQTAAERDAERDRHRRALIELAVHRAGSKMGADPDALLDSRSFLKKIRDLDTDAEDFSTKLGEAIQLAIDDNPKFKAAAGMLGPPARSGGEFAGGPGGRSPSAEPSIDEFRKRRGKPS